MCWYCCISLRGAVYFGTSIHIFVGLVLLVHWAVNSYIALAVTETLLTDISALITSVLCGIYTLLFIILGCLIFAGTERESVSMLKWSAAGFSLLQALVFTVILILYLVAPEGMPLIQMADHIHLLSIIMYFCCLIATANYILVLFLYIRKLWRIKTRRSRTSSAPTNVRISAPIIQQVLPPLASNHSNVSNHPQRYSSAPQAGHRQNHHHQQQQKIESPGIYESLDAPPQHHFYPANFYSGYRSAQESIYNGGGSIRSGSGSIRSYPYPHERHREPIAHSHSGQNSGGGGSVASTPSGHQGHQGQRRQEDWSYGTRLQVFQRGGERSSGTNEPLLTHPHHHY